MSIDLYVADTVRRRSADLFEQLRDAITSGRLRPGDRLPTSRELAGTLRLSRSTVTAVYGRLVAEGHAVARTGDGTFVADLLPWQRRPPAPGLVPVVAPRAAPAVVADLRAGRPDPRLFPVVAWRRSVVSALQAAPPGYGDPEGMPELRRVLAAWLARSRGVQCRAEQIVITSGAQGAFSLLARALLPRGASVAVEDPGYGPATQAFEGVGLRVVPVSVDTDGIDVDAIPAAVRAVYVTPSHQAPTGVVLAAGRRRQLLDRATRRGLVVIEDDYDSEYRYVDRPLEPLQRLDRADAVHYVGSFSKTLSPSLRLGFVVAPQTVVGRLVEARQAIDLQPPTLVQAALADFIVRGEFERHLRRTRRLYRTRRDLVVAHAEDWLHGGLVAAVSPTPAGLHTTITLPAKRRAGAADRIVERMRRDGVVIAPPDQRRLGPTAPNLVVGFGLADGVQLTAALDVMTRALRAEARR